jgi:hypothetical protein
MTLVTLSGRILGPHAVDVRALRPTRRRTAKGDRGVDPGVLRVAVTTEVGKVGLRVPRDRNASCAPLAAAMRARNGRALRRLLGRQGSAGQMSEERSVPERRADDQNEPGAPTTRQGSGDQ